KTLAAQLYSEFKQFFPRNAVEYFVSYFDYYQPEAYIPRSDTYIEKDSSINEEIERLRLSATSGLLSRRDVIVVASVSCIYGITSPEDYERMLLTVKRGQHISREAVLGRLVDMLYERNDMNFSRGRFRVRGDVVEVYPATADEEAVRIEFFGDEIDAITRFDPLTGHAREALSIITFFPAKQFVTPADKLNRALTTIRAELDDRIKVLESQNKLLEAQRLKMRTEYDLEMLQEMGFCSGIENYSECVKLTNQIVYLSASTAEFEMQSSVVGNKGYVPHKRARIGEDELVPFVLPGEAAAAVVDPGLSVPANSKNRGQRPRLQLSR